MPKFQNTSIKNAIAQLVYVFRKWVKYTLNISLAATHSVNKQVSSN